MFVNVYIIIGVIAAIVLLLYRNVQIERAINLLGEQQFGTMIHLEQSLGLRDEEVDKKLQLLEDKVEFLYEEERKKLSTTDS